MDSPVGRLLLAGDGDQIKLISFPSGNKCRQAEPEWTAEAGPFGETIAQLRAYFAGELADFELPLAPEGTDFQRSVWDALLKIPYGATVSYGEIARAIGRPKASRAVGAANGDNPIPIVVPCHRVIGSTGKLTGFGGGLEIKATLLDLERRHRPQRETQASFAFATSTSPQPIADPASQSG